jgi:tetratricopeptide (TPR) repeat protein
MRVVSRTSTEKYRNTTKSIPEMGKELNVNYFVEGSGQKVGDDILLNIQLIEATTDKHLWATQYKRKASDIFRLQQEVATNIADEIQAIITAEEAKRIKSFPTDNVEAYDNFLKGRDLLNKNGNANLNKSIQFFNKAIESDPDFAEAYAHAAMAYYFLDSYQVQRRFSVEIANYADKAMSYNPDIPESQVAKGLFYAHQMEHAKAVPHLEKALQYAPNSIDIINLLADFYCNNIPNTTKYLEYALMGVKLDMASQDSVTTSYTFLRLANALIQNGFVDEALKYVNKSLDYNPENPFASYVKVFILYGKENDVVKAKNRLLTVFRKDTTRVDILQDVGKLYYFMRDYDSAYYYYEKFVRMREEQQLDIYKHENVRIAYVYDKKGRKKEAEEFLRVFKEYADTDKTIYRELNHSIYHAYLGDYEKAMAHMRLFMKEDDYQYWILLGPIDPALDGLEKIPEFDVLNAAIRTKFWKNHAKIKVTLKEKGLL